MKNNFKSHIDIRLKGNVKYEDKGLQLELTSELNGCEWAIIIALLNEVSRFVKTKDELIETIDNIHLYEEEK